jgi:TolB protein
VTIALVALAAAVSAPATAAPTNGRIAFVNARSGSLDVWTMLPDGSAHEQLTDDPSSDVDPAPTSDGNMYVFVSNRDGNREIYAMNADGSGQARLTSTEEAEQDPAFSPDDQRVAFSRAISTFEAHIYSIAADGTDEVQVTYESGDDHSPAFSPDGSQIAFVRESNIFIADVDGTSVLQLTEGGGLEPAFFTDGRIAFRRGNDIHVMNADGSAVVNLTNSASFDADPSPSPDGRFIAFTTFRDGQFDIDVMDADGSNRRTLTSASDNDLSPSWGAIDLPPTTVITANPPALTNDPTPTFAFEADEEATFECSVTAPGAEPSFGACASPTTIDPALNDGDHVFAVRGTDVRGHLGVPATFAFRVDTVGPVVDMVAEGRYKDRTPTITFASEAEASFECSLDGSASASCTSPFAPGTLKPGPHMVEVRATDLAGNVGPAATQAFRIYGPPER